VCARACVYIFSFICCLWYISGVGATKINVQYLITVGKKRKRKFRMAISIMPFSLCATVRSPWPVTAVNQPIQNFFMTSKTMQDLEGQNSAYYVWYGFTKTEFKDSTCIFNVFSAMLHTLLAMTCKYGK
jgi:hypothetical protein